ncbi:STAS domain-containing protein [Anoxybacteroides amylolyticum]|uniref:STAS domain protein n=1 Tax=Anoxybacteroides amylolyticum TaxID=294699 RepID=A0A160F533_9BACL|nr:STAS domain-containing protein [Anoxybacillus amylolyticus]ANB61597.1 STAS domain protein [Anoxybacillus amylolyticus]
MKMPTIRIEATSTVQYAKISLKGKLVYSTQQMAKQTLIELFQQAEHDVYLFDVSELAFIDSTGLSMFVHLLKQETDKQKTFLFVFADNQAIQKLFTIAKLHRLFIFVPTERDAVRWLASRSRQPVNR